MFAPRHHAAMAHVVPVRKALGVRTIFNFLGPLTNPAGATRQLLGVSDRHYQETIAEALVGLGSVRAMVVAAEDGLDELSISARDPGDRGRGRRHRPSGSSSPASSASRGAELEAIAGGDAGGERRRRAGGARRRAGPAGATSSLLNAGAAIYVGGVADDLGGRGRGGARRRSTRVRRPSVLGRLVACEVRRTPIGRR